MLKNLIDEGLIDYAAMDIKNSRMRYNETCGSEVLPQIEKSVRLLMNGNIDFEFRTTVCKSLHTLNDMKDIGIWLKGAKRYFIQQFVDSGNVPFIVFFAGRFIFLILFCKQIDFVFGSENKPFDIFSVHKNYGSKYCQ